jgi:hypothetical protein
MVVHALVVDSNLVEVHALVHLVAYSFAAFAYSFVLVVHLVAYSFLVEDEGDLVVDSYHLVDLSEVHSIDFGIWEAFPVDLVPLEDPDASEDLPAFSLVVLAFHLEALALALVLSLVDH